jgi:glycerol-3-phosphate dehydrogenase
MAAVARPVLILGAGINGCAVARELALNGVPVWLVDSGDIARGATSRSSRLIHGGLRYLEYRDIALVRESLRERERLLKLAPQFVTPLRLAIPVSNWLGGLFTAACRFTGLTRAGVSLGKTGRRGLIAVRTGLVLYDWLVGRSSLGKHRVTALRDSAGNKSGPHVDRRTFRWVCEYSDAQMLCPERFVLALLADAKGAAEKSGSCFEIRTWSRVSRDGKCYRISGGAAGSSKAESIEPALVINATGAWGDLTLDSLEIEESQLFAGTKGSHLYSRHAGLREALCDAGIYAEAADGRLVFILPCGEGTLVGTTDLPHEKSPEEAVADDDEVEYLLEMVNSVFDSISLSVDDVEMRHAGVRPLPRVDTEKTSAIPRGHSIHSSWQDDVEVLTLIGGKLTTCRTLAEEVVDKVLMKTGSPRVADTAARIVPGGEDWPGSADAIQDRIRPLADQHRLSEAQAGAVWSLIGNRFAEVFSSSSTVNGRRSLSGTDIPLEFVRWSIHNEDCTKLEDLFERRLMLTFSAGLSRETLRELAEELVRAGRLVPGEAEAAIDEATIRLRHYYGKVVR